MSEQPTSGPSPRAEADLKAAAPANAVGPLGAPMRAAMAQATALLTTMEDVQRLQINMTHLALKRMQDWQDRAGRAGAFGDLAALPLEFGRFELAAMLRFWQELGDIGLRAFSQQGAQAGEAANAAADPWPAALNPAQWMALMHTGIRPIDDMFSAALNKDLVPPVQH